MMRLDVLARTPATGAAARARLTTAASLASRRERCEGGDLDLERLTHYLDARRDDLDLDHLATDATDAAIDDLLDEYHEYCRQLDVPLAGALTAALARR